MKHTLLALACALITCATTPGFAQSLEDYVKIARDKAVDYKKREEAVKAIGALPDKSKVAADLLPLLGVGELFQATAAVLSQTTVVATQAACLKDPADVNVQGAFSAMVRTGVKGAFDECARQLSAAEYLVRRRVLNVFADMARMHPAKHAQVVPVLPLLAERAATDANLLLRIDAVTAIGGFGKVAAPAVPALVQLLQASPDAEVRLAAATALGKIGDIQAAPPLIAALDGADSHLCYAAALALAQLGKPAVSPLTAALGTAKPQARAYIAFALAKLGPDAVSARPALEQALKDADARVRRNAADALGRLGDRAALPALTALAADPDLAVRLTAATALRLLAPDDAQAQATLKLIAEKNTQKPAYPELAKGQPVKDGSGVFFPQDKVAVTPTHHGEPAGYPGALPDLTNDKGEPKYPVWGSPEIQPYPGAVEHYRIEELKYLPAWTLFNAGSLRKNFRATELPEAKGLTEAYAEPVYFTPMYGQSQDTGKRNPPVQVVHATIGKPVFGLDLGTLDIGLYTVRVIGAVPGNPTGYRPPLYFDCQVNDQPGQPQALSRYRVRVGYVDEFYSLAEFYFYAPEKRAYRAAVQVGAGSAVEPLIYNLDLHDAWHGCVLRPIKTRMTQHTAAERDLKRAQYRELAEAKKAPKYHCGAYGTWQPQPAPLSPEERERRDRSLWNACMPMNHNYGPGYSDLPIADDDGWHDAGGALGAPQLRHDQLGLRYGYEDLLNYRPLPDPYPNKDDGGAVFLPPAAGQKYPRTFLPIARMLGNRVSNYSMMLNGLAAHHPGLAEVYFNTGDDGAARDAALMLVRLAYAMPTIDSGRFQVTMAIAGNSTDLQWGGKDHWTRRRINRQNRGLSVSIVESYDLLFDYIQGNQEFAHAVSRFIPWVRTPEDVIAFLDCSVQHYVKRCVHWHWDGFGGMSETILGATIAVGDWEFTRPWMEWLFRETWKYPNARAGLSDYATTSTTRDGTSYIGSWAYAQDRPACDYAKMTQAYVQAGGMKEFDLSDPVRFPKALAGCNFDFDGRAAGLHILGIGDVNGPAMPHAHQFGTAEERMRRGWQWSKDPRYAYALANHFGRKTETDADWTAIEKAAQGVVDPWFSQRSRVLSSWAGILEAGTESLDFRFRRAAMVRLGYGWGHQHDDTLDLILWCHGLIHAAEGGERPEKRSQDEVKGPADQKSFIHNLVEVDGDGSHRSGNWRGHSWAAALKDTAGARYLDAVAAPGMSHTYVSLYRRQLALIDMDDGRPAKVPPKTLKEALGKLDPDVTPPDAYVFDVFRVAGGRRHTYCFHGPANDEFKANTLAAQPVPYGQTESPEGRYLKGFICPDGRSAGKAPTVLDASWRIQRGQTELRAMVPVDRADPNAKLEPKVVFKMNGIEERTLGQNYDPQSPRKFTRLLLFGQEGTRVLTGRWIASAPAIAFDCLYTQRDLTPPPAEGQPGDLQSLFPAVIELYAGEPVIREQRLLAIEKNETDALAAAAVELKLRGDRTDVCFADGRPEQARKLANGCEVTGEFAFLSTDANGLRQATLTGGTRLTSPQFTLAVAARERRAGIAKVDYAARKVWLDQPWPGAHVAGQTVEIGTAKHRTSYAVTAADAAPGGTVLTLDKGMDFYASLIRSVDETKGEVVCGLGFPTDDGLPFPGLSDDVVVSNADQSKFWRGQYLGGTRETGFVFRLEGKISAVDFGMPGGKLRVWEIGVGDTVRLPTHVSWRRLEPGRYELTADAAFRVQFPGVKSMRLLANDKAGGALVPDKDGWFVFANGALSTGRLTVEFRRAP